ncbi:hypothetical protein A4X06_0g3704 [Tilletia controversa]|uniref:AAA+ ATPase domain-containing protein n=1 Tax=Tilletia controversa TaxID=13291 RepID=A0A8X7SXC9_9BASI|nr:hypothetical protein CF328_g2960 [Tilletia controversa]KAE8248450.1 hypothetical protein A4X06_0g3704 [Tilletia controversa]
MNRSITDAWAAGAAAGTAAGGAASQRRSGATRISLNTPVAQLQQQLQQQQIHHQQLPPGSAAAAAVAAAAASAAQGTHKEANAEDGTPTSPAKPIPALDGPALAANGSDVPTPTGSRTPGKRKLRISQRTESTQPSTSTSTSTSSTSKRQRSSLQVPSSSTIAEKYTPPDLRLADLGGVSAAIEKVLELIATPLCHPEIYAHTGVKPPRGILLHGPPGCGKTMLAGAIAGELGVPFLSISAPSIVSGTSGESEKTLRDTFEEAIRIAPSILFLDEIDAITPKRETAQREMERRIVAQLLTCLDDLSWEKSGGKPVMVIGATNRPDSLDPALRRAGRFDHEIAMGVPDEDGRERILKVLAKKLRLSGDFDFRGLAKATPGFVGADLSALTSAAGIVAVKRIFHELGTSLEVNGAPKQITAGEDVDMAVDGVPQTAASTAETPDLSNAGWEMSASAPVTEVAAVSTERSFVRPLQSFFDSLPVSLQKSSIALFLRSHPDPLTPAQLEPLSISLIDFQTALPSIQPSSKREGFATVPDVTWSDIGALHAIREELSLAIVQPIRRPELFRALGVSASSGVLLWGPPGCGKTLLAKAVANESRANFISVKGPELLNKYVGESERAVRQVFARARTSSPCVIFFDELDALVPRREDGMSESSARVVNTLLTELDGLEARVQTYVIAATNRPDMIDPAMCRPGRLDKLLYVDLPSPAERLEILKTLTKKSPLVRGDGDGAEVDLSAIAFDGRADGYSGADLAALVREAAVMALKEALGTSLTASATRSFVEGEGEETDRQPLSSFDEDVVVEVDGIGPGARMQIAHGHFVEALGKVQPSVSMAQRRRYEILRSRLSGTPAGARAGTETRQEKEKEGQQGGGGAGVVEAA